MPTATSISPSCRRRRSPSRCGGATAASFLRLPLLRGRQGGGRPHTRFLQEEIMTHDLKPAGAASLARPLLYPPPKTGEEHESIRIFTSPVFGGGREGEGPT